MVIFLALLALRGFAGFGFAFLAIAITMTLPTVLGFEGVWVQVWFWTSIPALLALLLVTETIERRLD